MTQVCKIAIIGLGQVGNYLYRELNLKKKDIEIKSADSQLTIKSVENDDKDEKETLHRGISKRKFSRTFTLADDIKVNGAELKDGMLLIDLEKIVPEEKKPRTIDIK